VIVPRYYIRGGSQVVELQQRHAGTVAELEIALTEVEKLEGYKDVYHLRNINMLIRSLGRLRFTYDFEIGSSVT
jgi:hypothetical protein